MAGGAQVVRVEGAGIAAALAAIVLKRAMPWAAVYWPGGSAMGAATGTAASALFGAAGSALAALHQRIGLDHRLFVRRTRAVALSGIAVAGFGRDGTLPLLMSQPFVEGAPLTALWQRAVRERWPVIPDFAELCRRVDAAPRSEWRFDFAAYHHLLVEMASAIGVVVGGSMPEAKGPSMTVHTDPQADAAWIDWSADHQVPPVAITELDRRDGQETVDQVVRTDAGINWHGPHRAFQLVCTHGSHAGVIAPGHHAQPRAGPVLRVGEAAVLGVAPDGTWMDVLCEDLLALFALGPGEIGSPRLDAEYARRATIRYGCWADWLAVQWRQPGPVTPNDAPRLQAILDDWDRRGWLSFRDGDAVAQGAWMAWLAVTRPIPARIDPTAMNISAQRMRRLFGEG
jgi:hypothetical protein